MKQFDITCTATLRPELLEATLVSHTNCLFKEAIKNANFYINVDMIGVEGTNSLKLKTLDRIVSLVKDFGFKKYDINFCWEPHFPTAFIWCMNQTKSELTFHLEEDWLMVVGIDFPKMIEMFSKYEDLVHLRLSAFNSEKWQCKNWNRFLNWNGDFFEVKENEKGTIGWAGHPSLNRTNFLKSCIDFMDPKINPEKQIKGRRYSHPINAVINMSRFGSFHPQECGRSIIDIGRKWMIDNGYRKAGNKAFFTNWERSEK